MRHLNPELFRKYITYAKKYVHPVLSPAAAKILQKLYLTMRAQSSLGDSIPVTTRHLESLIRLSQARARVELREEVTENGALVHVQIPFQDAFNGSFNAKGEFCIVSHRWMELGVPDADGVQFRAIQAHLRAHPHIKFVWYDFWCMPQGYKAPADLVNFKWMLSNINVLYLSLGVVILLDLSYFSRFWTQYVRRERMTTTAQTAHATANCTPSAP